jgi:hypothetical protein
MKGQVHFDTAWSIPDDGGFFYAKIGTTWRQKGTTFYRDTNFMTLLVQISTYRLQEGL